MRERINDVDVTSTQAVVGVAGRRTLVITSVVFALAAVVPIDSAVIAGGKLAASGNNIQISHPTGGRVIAVYARDGDRIRRGDPIIEIDPSVDQAQLGDLAARSASLETERVTLEREIAGLSELRLGQDVVGGNEPGLASGTVDWTLKTSSLGDEEPESGLARTLERQQLIGLQSRLDRIQAERDILESRIVGQQSRLKALRLQYQQMSGLREPLEARAKSARKLLKAGHMSSVEALDYELQAMENIARIDNLKSEVVVAEAALVELQSQLRQINATSRERTQTRLLEVIRDSAAI